MGQDKNLLSRDQRIPECLRLAEPSAYLLQPLPEVGHSEQDAQGHIQVALEELQGERLLNLHCASAQEPT